MVTVKKEEIEMKLRAGNVIYMVGSHAVEKRLYRFNAELNTIEYSDDNVLWKKSNLNINALKDSEWAIL